MSRTVSTTITTATGKDATKPIYLLRLGFSAEVKAATYDTDISWNGETWIDSGIEVRNLTRVSGSVEFPLSTDDPWLSLVLNEGTRGRSISIYSHYTDETASPQADAVLIFTGVMDEPVFTDVIKLSVIESSQAKKFPPDSIDVPVFNFLLKPGARIDWKNDTVVAN